MANKTKLRLGQISGSLGPATGGNGVENAFTFAAGTDNRIYINMDTRNTNLLQLGSPNVGVKIDGPLSGGSIGKSAGNLIPIDAGAGLDANDFVKVHGSNNTLVGRSPSEVRADIGVTFGVAENNTLQADSGIADNDFLKVNGSVIEGRSDSEMRSDLSLVKGIANGNILEIDGAAGLAGNDFIKLHASNATVIGRSPAETLGDIGGQAALGSIASAVSINNQKLENLANPTANSDAATKQYVDQVAAGLQWVAPVEAATTGSILNTVYDDGTNELRSSVNGSWNSQYADSIDREPLQFNTDEDLATRILIKDQTGAKGFLQFSVDGVPTNGQNMTFEINDVYYQINFVDGSSSNNWGGGNGSNSGSRKTFDVKRNNGGESESTIAQSIRNAFNFEFDLSATTPGNAEVVRIEQKDPRDQAVTNNVAGTASTDNESQAAGQSSRNGIYYAREDGDGSSVWKFRRASDSLDINELSATAVFVQRGETNADQGFVQTSDFSQSDTLDDAHQNWVQFTGGAALTGEKGVNKTGTTLSLDMNTLTAAVVNVANDFIGFIDADDSNKTRKESISDLVAGMVNGNNGMSSASGVLSVALKGNGGLELDGNDVRIDFGNTTNAVGTLAINRGGTGGSTASAARTSLGLVLGTANGNILEIDGAAGISANDFIKVHGSNATVVGRSPTEVRGDIGVTFGIANGNVLEIDGAAGIAQNDFIKVHGSNATIVGRSPAEVRADIGVTFGVANTNTLQADNGIVDDDFLRVNGSVIEGLSVAEMKTALGVPSTAAAATQKQIVTQSAFLAANQDLAVPAGGGSFNSDFMSATQDSREIYLNGQLLLEGANSGADNDWYEGSGNNIRFEFDLEVGDVLQFILRA